MDDNFQDMAISMQNKEAIKVLNFIGRQLGCLTDIMDQLNRCYSIQVI